MTIQEFSKYNLNYYKVLEDEFKTTLNYVTVEKENYSTYSNIYQKLLLSIGSEIDNLINLVVELYNDKPDKNRIQKLIKYFPDIVSLQVQFKNNKEISLTPWSSCSTPKRWTVYNESKHNRFNDVKNVDFDNDKKWYQYANLENTLNSLAGLYCLESIAYKKIVEDNNSNNNDLFVSLPIDSIFKILNSSWEKETFCSGFSIKDEQLDF